MEIVTTNLTAEALAYQGSVVDELNHFNYEGHNAACSTARKPVGGNKGFNVSSITETRTAIAIHNAKYYEDMGHYIDTNFVEWGWIKHFKSLVQIEENWINPDSLP